MYRHRSKQYVFQFSIYVVGIHIYNKYATQIILNLSLFYLVFTQLLIDLFLYNLI